MKYLISNDKISNLIYEYLDGELSEERNNDVQFTWTRLGGKKSGIAHLMKDYEYIFVYIQREYFDGTGHENTIKANQCPILEFEDDDFYKKLNAVFGDYWKPVFEDWFRANYPLKVKTFIYP